MYILTKADKNNIRNLFEITADTLSDIQSLPTDRDKIRAGSTCICIEDSSVWILGNDYEWHQL